MAEKETDREGESLVGVICDLAETGALVVDEIITSLKPSEEECRRLKSRFWELQSKLAAGLATVAEHRLRDLKTTPPERHADRIVVEED